jgi:hypothetical protein
VFGVARRLGLDPAPLLAGSDEPHFLWQAEARFKHLTTESSTEQSGIASFGRSVASILIAASPEPALDIAGASAAELREQLLRPDRPYVTLGDVLTACWTAGVAVAHLRVFPWERKRMAAMALGIGGRSAILLGKDSSYPAPIAFFLAHELGHVALGHVSANDTVIDLGDELAPSSDGEEQAADEFALELLTGQKRPRVVAQDPTAASGRELARVALASGSALAIEPGMLAQCFGYSTGNWQTANAALRHIYPDAAPMWEAINAVAVQQLDPGLIPIEAADFLAAVLSTRTTMS